MQPTQHSFSEYTHAWNNVLTTGTHPQATRADLLARLHEGENFITQIPSRILSSSFTPTDSALCGFPVSLTYEWSTLSRILALVGARAVMLRTPGFMQLSSLVYRACRSTGSPLYPNEQENIPIGIAALKGAGINTIITTVLDAAIFARTLLEKSLPIPAGWVVLHNEQDAWRLPVTLQTLSCTIAQEIHLFPGVPLLTQCEALIHKRAPTFHKTDLFEWNTTPLGTEITALSPDMIPFGPVQLGYRLEITATCACGELCYQKV